MRILIYRLGSLGDTVIALPCFRLIRSRHPTAEITVLTNLPVSGKAAAIEAVLENTGLVDRFIPYPVGLRDPKKLAGETGSGLIVDLNQPDALRAAAEWRKGTGQTVVGFVSHVDTETIETARQAGIDRILARSQFEKNLPDILRELHGP